MAEIVANSAKESNRTEVNGPMKDVNKIMAIDSDITREINSFPDSDRVQESTQASIKVTNAPPCPTPSQVRIFY